MKRYFDGYTTLYIIWWKKTKLSRFYAPIHTSIHYESRISRFASAMLISNILSYFTSRDAI